MFSFDLDLDFVCLFNRGQFEYAVYCIVMNI